MATSSSTCSGALVAICLVVNKPDGGGQLAPTPRRLVQPVPLIGRSLSNMVYRLARRLEVPSSSYTLFHFIFFMSLNNGALTELNCDASPDAF